MQSAAETLAFSSLQFMDNDQQRKHWRRCKKKATCDLCRYIIFKNTWKHRLMMDPPAAVDRSSVSAQSQQLTQGAWLDAKWTQEENEGIVVVKLGCVACNQSKCERANSTRLVSYAYVGDQRGMRVTELASHAKSETHRSALLEYLQIEVGPTMKFASVWDAACRGQRKIDSVGQAERARKLQWCLWESIKEADREFLMRDGVQITLLRDERQGRLALRYVAVDKKFEARRGVLGQTKASGTGSEEINKDIMQAQLDARSVLEKVKVLTVDAASDEMTAGRLGRRPSDEGGITPNLSMIIRDKTYASRRAAWVAPETTTKKPQDCDPTLHMIDDNIFKSKNSIVQRIHHLRVWRSELERYIVEMEQRVATVKNVKAANHRHDSEAKPKGRFCLFMPAFLQVAGCMAVCRGGEEKTDARNFLRMITEEVCIQVAMMADAADEGLLFTRELDSEESDAAEMASRVKTFLAKLEYLFNQEVCLVTLGYTRHMLHLLTDSVRVLRISKTQVRSIGGPTCLDDGVAVRTCMQRIRSFVRVSISVTVAKFPNYEIVSAFRVFCIDEKKKSQNVYSDPEFAACFERLAMFYSVDQAQLQAEFADLAQVAKSRMVFNGCSVRDAWQCAATRAHAMQSASRGPANLRDGRGKRFRMTALGDVLQGYLAASISTAGVEQDFSRFKRVFGEQALGALDSTEAMVAKLVLDRSHVELKDNFAMQRAQEIWGENFNKPRNHGNTVRIDKGVKRPVASDSKEASTEVEWQRRRRRSVIDALASVAEKFEVGADAVEVDEHAWQESHQKMVDKQLAIDRRNKAEALMDGALISSEIDLQTIDDSKNIVDRRIKNDRERNNKDKYGEIFTSKQTVDLATLANVHWHMDDGAKEAITLEQANRALSPALMETDPLKATFFLAQDTGLGIHVVQDPARASFRQTWTATLVGGLVASPSVVLNNGKGAMLACKSALGVQRKLYISNDFENAHKNAYNIFREVAFKSKNWVELRTIEDYKEAVKKHKTQPTRVAYLKVAGEIVEDVHTSTEFFTFIQKLDNAKVQDGR
ncbi:unnamed protein product [Prorocentrum cordatum]|uniref:Uncharacterized protein n=1 Tax=Prorocentrum cordatum TaxID=2364126 RepID=A0ABN9S1Z6_9DINO|nr:unnamed protein product [Polarella glacialis]